MRWLAAAFCLSCLCVTIVPQSAGASWEQLKQDGRVALIRHAEAPGSGDPPGWRIGDCKTQRNLSERGRAQARALGERFRAQAVPVGKVVSSQWCRTVETARLMNLGDVEQSAAFNNAHVLSSQRLQLAADGRAYVDAWRGPGVLVVVTHGANILALAGLHPREAEVVVIEPDSTAQSKIRVLGRIPPAP